ncbi:uncharacterized protein LOC126373226 [Pectinophora gossypiella]|uniref:uncharacterized protein LOC126373226 n=1 Tax=Pectinophora gossypiella TaxID=13191 RepID=UPI00214E6757|nr:uncharacterized protein LOC126373226 [Pectinophora gossypiella]
MPLPKLKRCCGCVPLETGCIALGFISFMACIAAIGVCSWKLPEHKEQQNEDNLVLLSMTMFATLSAISNLTVLAGIALKRPSFLQLAILSNSVFILCIFLISIVTCLFSPGLEPHLQSAGNITLVVILLISGAVYSMYYMTIVNSQYTKMKMAYGDSAIPV